MRSKADPARLREISTIRGLQRAKAEGQATAAATELQHNISNLSETKREQTALEQAWAESLSTPSLHIEMVELWGQALLRQNECVQQAGNAVETSKKVVHKRSRELHAATERDTEAKDIEKRAVRDVMSRRDEARMAQALDRYALRVVRP